MSFANKNIKQFLWGTATSDFINSEEGNPDPFPLSFPHPDPSDRRRRHQAAAASHLV